MRLYWEVLIGSKIVQKYLRFHICDIILDDIMRVRLCSVRPYDIIFSKSHLNKISHIFSRLFISVNILELEPRRCLSPVHKSPSLSNYFILKSSILDFHQNWEGGWSINVAETFQVIYPNSTSSLNLKFFLRLDFTIFCFLGFLFPFDLFLLGSSSFVLLTQIFRVFNCSINEKRSKM